MRDSADTTPQSGWHPRPEPHFEPDPFPDLTRRRLGCAGSVAVAVILTGDWLRVESWHGTHTDVPLVREQLIHCPRSGNPETDQARMVERLRGSLLSWAADLAATIVAP